MATSYSSSVTKISTLSGSKPGSLNSIKLIEWLLADRMMAPADAQLATEICAQAQSSLHPVVRLAQMGVKHAATKKAMEVDELLTWLAKRAGLDYVRIDPLRVDASKVGDTMSLAYAQRNKILPIQVHDKEVIIATIEPFVTDWRHELERQTQLKVRLVLTHPQDIERYTVEFFNIANSVKAVEKIGLSGSGASFEQLVELGKGNNQLDANDMGVVQVVDWLWSYAFDQRASDIHIEPKRDHSVIRFRIDGVLHTVYQMPSSVMGAIVARIKLLGRMDVVEKRRPQDGRVKTRRAQGDDIEMRLSTLPTAFGEKLVMRLFDTQTAQKTIDQLGFSQQDASVWDELIHKPYGIVLVTGPTGSGKTSTLYATLKRLATDAVNVSTVEDPIEMIEPSFNQTQVQPQLEFGFAEGLRSLMRQDPDIIMVGEIRDLETSTMAIQAALTGHLVFSTLHTNDAPSAINRMLDLGVPSYLLNASLIGVMAQRLVRTLCSACKQPDPQINPEVLHNMVKPWTITGVQRIYKAVGCLECRMTGFKGRVGLYELLLPSEAFRATLSRSNDLDALRQQALRDGLKQLRLAGAIKIAEGITTIEEVLANTPSLTVPVAAA